RSGPPRASRSRRCARRLPPATHPPVEGGTAPAVTQTTDTVAVRPGHRFTVRAGRRVHARTGRVDRTGPELCRPRDVQCAELRDLRAVHRGQLTAPDDRRPVFRRHDRQRGRLVESEVPAGHPRATGATVTTKGTELGV